MRSRLNSAALIVTSFAMTVGLVAFADPARADVTMPHTVVQTADLDLARPAGRATAERRIHAAADRVCLSGGDVLGDARCRTQAIEDADTALQAEIARR